MVIYCLEDFKVEFEKLISKKSYKSLEQEIINYFFDKPVQDLCSGIRLNHSPDAPYIKKRLKGKGGFRCYFLLIIKQENLYLMFVHPKSGTLGSDNITDESKAYLYKKILECIKKLFKFYPSGLLCVFFHHASAIFRCVAMAMHLKIPSPDKKIHYKIFQKQNLNSF